MRTLRKTNQQDQWLQPDPDVDLVADGKQFFFARVETPERKSETWGNKLGKRPISTSGQFKQFNVERQHYKMLWRRSAFDTALGTWP